MLISVVVPAFNEEKLISGSLRSMNAALAAFRRLDWETEIVVCDNNSTDRTAELARAAGARVVFEPINQISRARNAGAAAAQGDWLIFVDADTHPSPELFADVAEAIQSGRYIAGGSTLKMEQSSVVFRLFNSGWNCLSHVVQWFAGAFIFCEASAFREVGGFNEELFASEEIDLSKKLRRLARKRGRKLTILRKHPILTSSRKLHLYSGREMLRVFRGAILRPSTLKSREACSIWYDGRR